LPLLICKLIFGVIVFLDSQCSNGSAGSCDDTLASNRIPGVMLATVATRQNNPGLWYEQEWERCNGSYHTRTGTIAIGPALLPKSKHFNPTTLSPLRNFNSDRIII